MATTFSRIELLDFLQPTIATFYMAVPSELAGVEYLCEMVKLNPLQDILLADLVLGAIDTAHPVDRSSVVVLQVMQIRSGWGPDFACMEHGAPDTRTVNSSSGGDGKWLGGEDGQVLTEFDTASYDSSQFTNATWG